ncbi:MAG: TonB-dependent receptor [Blastocatellia bacterium]|nr:TonB-dependent receptor [Blastocatellia bacterium]
MSFLTLCVIPAFTPAQSATGTLIGAVSDQNNAAIVGARVTVVNINTGARRQVTTNEQGDFTIPLLPPSIYSVLVEQKGFAPTESKNVELNVNTTVRLDFKLAVSELTQVVDVKAEPSMLSAEGANLGKVMPTKAIMDLPLFIGGGLRSTMAFIILTPGVIGDQGDPRIGGGLLGGQSERLDGGEAQNEQRVDPAFLGISVEGLQEFKVQSSGYSAEYGRTSNGVINFVSKSGTNELHGTAFTFLRNEAFNARGFTFGPGTRQVSRQINPGGSIGGPVYIPGVFDGRNKAFFFFSIENAHFKGGSPSNLITVPTDEFRNGDFRNYKDAAGNMIPLYDPIDPATGNIITDAFARPRLQCNGVLNVICPDRIDPIAKALQSRLPEPDNPNQAFNNTRAVGRPEIKNNVYSIKGDYALSDKSHISGLYSRFHNPETDVIGPVAGIPSPTWTNDIKIQYYRINHDYVIRPNLLHHFTIGYNRRNMISGPSPTVDDAYRQAVQIPGTTVAPKEGNMTRYNTEFLSYGTQVDTDSRSKTFSISEQLAWIKGKHNMKFGFEYLKGWYRRLDCNDCQGSIGFSQAATGNPGVPGRTGSGYAAFLLGLAGGGNFNYSGDNEFFFPYYAWYVQDDFKVNSKLTLNLGLRYDLPIPKEETNHENSNFNPALPNPGAGGLPGAMEFAGEGPGRSGKARFGETRKNAFGPRLGFAYLLAKRTVIRAGGSIYYQPTREDANADRGTQGFAGEFLSPGNYLATGISFRLADGFNTFTDLVNANRPPKIDPTIQLYGSPFYVFRKAGRAPYFMDYNFTVEHSFSADTVFRASFHENMGVKLLSWQQNINQLDPKYWAIYGTLLGQPLSIALNDARVIASGYTLPYPGYPLNRQLQQALRPYPQYNDIVTIAGGMNDGHMTYNALETSIEHRFSQGLFLMASYTFAKMISNTDSEGGRGGAVQNQYNQALDKSVGINDTPHNAALMYVYELPFGRGQRWMSHSHPVIQGFLGNWRISGVHRYVSGTAMGIGSGQNLYGAGTPRASFALEPAPMKNPQFDPNDPGRFPYLNAAAFRRPADMEYGNTPRLISQLRTPALLSEDFSLLKNINLGSEKRYLEFRATAFNIFNRHRLGGIDTNLDSPTFGMITNPQVNSPREIQFGLKFYF